MGLGDRGRKSAGGGLGHLGSGAARWAADLGRHLQDSVGAGAGEIEQANLDRARRQGCGPSLQPPALEAEVLGSGPREVFEPSSCGPWECCVAGAHSLTLSGLELLLPQQRTLVNVPETRGGRKKQER